MLEDVDAAVGVQSAAPIGTGGQLQPVALRWHALKLNDPTISDHRNGASVLLGHPWVLEAAHQPDRR